MGAASRARTPSAHGFGIDALHPDVIAAARDLFADGYHSQAIFEAFQALDRRVSEQAGIDLAGRDLMNEALSGDPPPIDVSIQLGQIGRDEQEGFRLLFMGAAQGIRNPRAYDHVHQDDDPQRAFEYLALVSLLFRRLDEALLP